MADLEPELELIQPHMAHKPFLRSEVGARADLDKSILPILPGPGLVDPAGPLRSDPAFKLGLARSSLRSPCFRRFSKRGSKIKRAPHMPPWRWGRELGFREQRKQRASRAREEKAIQNGHCFEKFLTSRFLTGRIGHFRGIVG